MDQKEIEELHHIADLLKMLEMGATPKDMVEAAYDRGFSSGKELAKKKIIEAIVMEK